MPAASEFPALHSNFGLLQHYHIPVVRWVKEQLLRIVELWMSAIAGFVLAAGASVGLLARWAPVSKMPVYLTIPLALAIYVPAAAVILVPIDLVDSSEFDSGMRLAIWRVLYWLSFVLTWGVLPVLMFYVESGYRDPGRRLADALRSNIRYQVALCLAAVAGLFYMGISIGLSPSNLKALAVALSHCYALVLTVWLLGHGLVNLPREIWRSQPSTQLHSLYTHAPYVCDKYAEARANYDGSVTRVMSLLPVKTAKYNEWIDALLDDIRSVDPPFSGPTPPPGPPAQLRDLTDMNLAALSKRLHRDQHRAVRSRADWIAMLHKVAFYEDISNARDMSLEFRLHRTFLSPRGAYLYYVIARPHLMRLLAVSMVFLSAAITLSEVAQNSWSVIDVLVKNLSGIGQFLVASLTLFYMCCAAFHSLTHVRFFDVYALVPKASDPASLLFYAMYACRLAVPLSYNFLVCNPGTETVFQNYLGRFINLTPLGKYFNRWLPRLILVPMSLTLFRIYDWAQNYFGFGVPDFNNDDDDNTFASSQQEGRELVQRALTDPRFRWSLDASMCAEPGMHPDLVSHRSMDTNISLNSLVSHVSSWVGR